MSGLLGQVDLPVSVDDRWVEDYLAGGVYEFGHKNMSEEEIVEFARRYDSQSIHTDPESSMTGPFVGLIASAVSSSTRSRSVRVLMSTTISLMSPVWLPLQNTYTFICTSFVFALQPPLSVLPYPQEQN